MTTTQETTQNNKLGYKGFNPDMTCDPLINITFQYAENTTYEEEVTPSACDTGFHYCTNPLDVLNYYPLLNDNCELNCFAKVEALGDIDIDNNTKYATNKIKIGSKLSLKEYVNECVKCMKENGKAREDGNGDCSNIATSDDYSQIVTSRVFSQIATNGHYSNIVANGYGSKIATNGNLLKIATNGNCLKVATNGDSSQIVTNGILSKVATNGDSSQIVTNGILSKVVTNGYGSQVNIQGRNSVVASIGIGGRIKGVIGTWITLAEYNNDGMCVGGKWAMIDGITLKENVWYMLENGKFVEVE